MNLFYEPFPETVEINEKEYPIVTDFREWIRFADMISSWEIDEQEKIFLMMQWFLKPPNDSKKSMIDALFSFYRADALELHPFQPESENEQETVRKPPVFDWCIDAKFVIGDFRRYYNINLLTVKYLHWWEFRCLFSALPDDSNCQKRIAYRAMDLSKIKDKSERKRIAKIQREIAIPYLTEEEEEYQLGDMLWNL